MKKILSIGLLFLIIISSLVGCVKAPDGTSSNSLEGNIENNSSAALEEIDINDWYNADFLSESEKEELFEKFRTKEISYHNTDLNHREYMDYFRKEDSSTARRAARDMGKLEEWIKIEQEIIKENLGEKGLNTYNMTEKEQEAFLQYFLTKAPEFYEIIHRLEIPKENLIKANNKIKEEFEQGTSESKDYSLEDLTFTDEEIELLYSADKDTIREYFKGPHTIFHNNKVHTIYYFQQTEPERWLEDGIPLDALKTWIKGIEEADIEIYIRPKIYTNKEIQKIVLETYFIKQKIKEYEILLAAQ
ncbi:MAG: hypothetical protein J6K88_04540 [Oscillospiraceae bacterium]|nr:hypothetical protein [Oscillospiraceae bacterium]